MTAKRVLSVGQCSADHGALSASLRRSFDVEVIGVDDTSEALQRLAKETFDLVLVNRIFDVNGAAGLDLIRELKQGKSTVPVMLVSNYEDAQREAIAVGALPGFGKAALRDPATIERLRGVLGA